VALWAGVATAGVPIPVVTGPIPANVPPGDPSHDYPQLATSLDLARPLDLASLGYVEEEYFFSSTANVYNTPTLATGTIVSSGHPYKSRIIVRRPTSPARFNGTVLVEWVNVTSGYNNDTLVRQSQDHLVRAGFAYVGVSAQRVGVQVPPGGLTEWSPIRYGSLDVTDNGTITDDALSYDIFSQAAQAIRTPRGVDMLAGLPVRRIHRDRRVAVAGPTRHLPQLDPSARQCLRRLRAGSRSGRTAPHGPQGESVQGRYRDGPAFPWRGGRAPAGLRSSTNLGGRGCLALGVLRLFAARGPGDPG